jgi:RNA polymerase sigma-70 factor (ECF subfamily)
LDEQGHPTDASPTDGSLTDLSLTELFGAARDGDRAALATAIRSSQAEVWRFVAHHVGADAADDVTQDTYVRAWRALPAYRGDASGRTWLLSIARRACADALRRRTRVRRLFTRLEQEAAVAPREMPDPAGVSGVEALVSRLEPKRREAFVLTQVVGCSYEEAAAVCEVPVGTIRSRVARARADLLGEARAADTG